MIFPIAGISLARNAAAMESIHQCVYLESTHTGRRILMKRNLIGLLSLFGLALSLSLPAAAQETANAQSDSSRVSRVPAGQKQRLRGVIVKREADSFILRDLTGSEVQVNLSNITKVEEKKGNPFRRAKD